jgi:alanine-glyoxylate transaminase/serine-glyoxylate transaminase/serine-pyruvate transaminase
MFGEEGLPAVFARHRRHAEATRRAVRSWGLDIVCRDPAECSSTLTAVLLPDGQDADRVREIVLDRFNASLGAGLGRLAGRVFRIGHLGDLGDLTLAGTLCGAEMGLALAGVPIERAGVRAALDYLESAGPQP